MPIFEVDYLAVLDQKDLFCSSIPAFNSLLQSIDGLVINGNKIEFGALNIGYEVQAGEISSGGQRFFHMRFLFDREDKLDEFEDLLRSIRTILSRTSGRPIQIIWDGTSLFYAQKSYPLIYEIENIMRKLITKFMLINIGLSWADEVVPKEVNESIRNKPQRSTYNYLYEVDFIQLSNFLFKEYTKVNTSTLLDKIRKANNIADLDLNDLKESIPQSNWARYFSSLVDCDSDYLRIRWEKLYERRNQVAHNKAIAKAEFHEIVTLINDLKPKLEKALDSLDIINVSQEDREIVAENIAGNRSAGYGMFFNAWGHLEHLLLELALLGTVDESRKQRIFQFRNNVRALLNILAKEQQVISRELRSEILELFKFRNVIVHHADAIFTEESIQDRIQSTEIYIEKLTEIIRNLQIKELPDEDENPLNCDTHNSLEEHLPEIEGEGDSLEDKS